MPTFDRSATFKRDYKSLDRANRRKFRSAVDGFVEDLTKIEEGKAAGFRPSLRVKPMQNNPGVWEMTWDGENGRATFRYGAPRKQGKRHVEWSRIGGHAIFGNP